MPLPRFHYMQNTTSTVSQGKTQGNCHAFNTCCPGKNGGAIRDPKHKGRSQSQEGAHQYSRDKPPHSTICNPGISVTAADRDAPHCQKRQVPRPSPAPGRGYHIYQIQTTPLLSGQLSKMGFKYRHPLSPLAPRSTCCIFSFEILTLSHSFWKTNMAKKSVLREFSVPKDSKYGIKIHLFSTGYHRHLGVIKRSTNRL